MSISSRKSVVTLAGSGVLVFLALFGFTLLQERWRATAEILPVTFGHIDHTTVNCVTCHHNYVDDSGQGLCFDCHKTDPEVVALIEDQFHALCRDCHVEKQREGEAGGPTRDCHACHEGDEVP